jgi:predicted metallopeptidase
VALRDVQRFRSANSRTIATCSIWGINAIMDRVA